MTTEDGESSPRPASAAEGPQPDARVSPPRAGDIVEYDDPPPGDVFTTKGSHVDITRRRIAYSLLGLLFLMSAVGGLGWLIHGNDIDRIQTYAVLFSPIVTLVSAVLGFYFSQGDGRGR